MDVELGTSAPTHLPSGGDSGQNGGYHPAEEKDRGGGWRDVVLAYDTIGIVFGGILTSPLYVYSSMNLKSPKEEDYLGLFSIMFWTLTLIGVVKYACIALNADDHGEGGTFALYSLLCRHANIGIFPSRNPNSGKDISHPNRSNTENQSKLGKFIEGSMTAKRMLLLISMFGLCMLIGDGVLTPAISVVSAMDGLRGPIPAVSKSAVEGLSAVILVALFLLQKYGTSRVSFLFSPIMVAWAFTTPIIGGYDICRYYPGIFKALSPHHIVYFFLRNGKEGWKLLAGAVLCITSAEAMFADLGHFNKRSIQLAFLSFVYPSLVITYAGQTAYLIKNLDDYANGFFHFIPSPVYWPMFIIATLSAIVASQSLISAAFSVIKQSVVLDYFPRVKIVHTSQHNEGEVYSPDANYILMVLCVSVVLIFGDGKEIGNAYGVVVILVMLITTILLTLVMIIIWRTPLILAALYFVPFFILEGVYVSAVFTKFLQGGWLPFAISSVLACIMFGWYYGRERKVEYEITNKLSSESLGGLLSRSEIQRVPGLCFFYSSVEDGLTPILGHYIKNMHALHKVTIFMTLRYLLVAKVAPNERMIIKKLGHGGVYGCVIQYGYADSFKPEGDDFVTQVTNSLRAHIEDSSDGLPETFIEEEISQLEAAILVGVVHVQGRTRFHLGPEVRWYVKFLLGFYEFLHRNCRSALPTLGIPLQQRMEIGMLYDV